MDEKRIVSWGAGVNSTAIIALHLLGKLPGKPEIVFADTGAELPETYEYIEAITKRLSGWKITRLHPATHSELYASYIEKRCLYEYLWDKATVPLRRVRFCTSRYKQRPIRRYSRYSGGRVIMIGICKDESHRMRDDKSLYPLADYTRADCVQLVADAGLPPAHKTGCFMCPFQPKKEWLALHDNHPALWEKAYRLEDRSKYTYKDSGSIKACMNRWLRERELARRQLLLFT